MNAIGTVCATALRLWSRQTPAVILTLLVPVVLMGVFGTVFGSMGAPGDSGPIELIVVDEDHSPQSQHLADSLRHADGLSIVEGKTDKATGHELPYDRALAETDVRGGEYGSVLIIPRGYGTALATFSNDDKTQLLLESDTSRPIETGILRGLLERTLFTSFSTDMAKTGMAFMGRDMGLPPMMITMMQGWMDRNAKFMGANPTSASTAQAAPGSSGPAATTGEKKQTDALASGPFGVRQIDLLGTTKANPIFSQQMAGVLTLFMLFTVASSGASLLRERDNGTLRRTLLAPVSPAAYLTGKYCAFFLLATLQTWVMFLAGWLIFRVEIWQHAPALAFFGLVTALAATSFGILLAACCKTHEQVSSVSTLLVLTMSALGGSMMPRELFPPTIHRLGDFTFNGWAMEGFTKILWRDEGISGILTESAVMLGMAVVLGGIAMWLFSKKLAR